MPRLILRSPTAKNIIYLPQQSESGRGLAGGEGVIAHVTAEARSSELYIFTLDDQLVESEMVGEEQAVKAALGHIFGLVIDEVVYLPDWDRQRLMEKPGRFFLASAWSKKSSAALDLLRLHYLTLSGLQPKAGTVGEAALAVSRRQAISPELARVCPVAVVNTTNIRGLAGKISQILEDSGVLVIRTTQSEVKFDQTTIYLEDGIPDECVQLAERIGKLFPEQPTILPQAAGEATQYRAKIVVMVGLDLSAIIGN
jgi:hypothetical protein